MSLPRGRCSCGQEHADALHGDAPGEETSLLQSINHDGVRCLNESVHGAGAKVFKSMDRKLDTREFVEAEIDDELIFYIPYALISIVF
jgi:hypothetical protein